MSNLERAWKMTRLEAKTVLERVNAAIEVADGESYGDWDNFLLALEYARSQRAIGCTTTVRMNVDVLFDPWKGVEPDDRDYLGWKRWKKVKRKVKQVKGKLPA